MAVQHKAENTGLPLIVLGSFAAQTSTREIIRSPITKTIGQADNNVCFLGCGRHHGSQNQLMAQNSLDQSVR